MGLHELGPFVAERVAFGLVSLALLLGVLVESVELAGDQLAERRQDVLGYLHAAVVVLDGGFDVGHEHGFAFPDGALGVSAGAHEVGVNDAAATLGVVTSSVIRTGRSTGCLCGSGHGSGSSLPEVWCAEHGLDARQAKAAHDQTEIQREQVAAAWEQTQLQRDLAHEALQPYVWADIQPDVQQGTVMHVVVGNNGPTVAAT
ncbi:hypothetical protein GGG17_02055 [Arsenicicoccus sp. MKL-02]|uniref:Uncharacterized protein n=1 Tax=Arsenicicoccus cauae TaxID=2663847 RepID=A0A6I3I9B7_9MICO|nr:hypothetical protein [Arsenicicoccus cauae]MTB70778.1 hypothetical protein [Arsenicicoccus cauae]